MADRLGSADAAFWQVEETRSPQQVGTLLLCHDPDERLDHNALVDIVERQLAQAPRYRQVVRSVPGRLANPVWVDDPEFDVRRHVQRQTVDGGADEQLHEVVAALMSRPLDRDRPLWELHLLEGLTDGRVAILSKSHHVLVDGVGTPDLGQLIIGAAAGSDAAPTDAAPTDAAPTDAWRAGAAPSSLELVVEALADVARQRSQVVDAVRAAAGDVRGTAGRLAAAAATTDVRAAAGRLAAAAVSVGAAARATFPQPTSPLRPPPAGQDAPAAQATRLFATVDTALEDYRVVHAKYGTSVNDVVLATITGALRTWLETRGYPLAIGASITAIVPVSVSGADGDDDADAGGGLVKTYLVGLPVGEPNAVLRLHQVVYATEAHRDSGRAVDASTLVRMPGFAPPTLHALGARVASRLTQRSSHLVIMNVPGPQTAMYVGGARLLRPYPVTPLPPGQAVSIGITSYDGVVCYGLYADRATMGDVEKFGQCIVDSLAELVRVASRP